jgi:hemolysin D
MNAPVTALQKVRKPKPPAKKTQSREDMQFLPAALEILETPPSPLALTLVAVICLFFTSAIAWAWFGRVDIIAVAQGKVQPNGRVKVVQPLETGRVIANLVENGDSVKQGDLLVQLDSRAASAEKKAIEADLYSYSAEAIRRETAIKLAQAGTFSPPSANQWPEAIPASIREREEHVLAADLSQLDSQIASFNAQSEQKKSEKARIAATVSAEKDLIRTLQERVAIHSKLLDANAGTKSDLINARETLETQITYLAQLSGQVAEIEANLDVVSRDKTKAIQTFIAENAQKKDEAERQIGTLSEKLNGANAKLDQLVLKSPIDGVVQGSAITTLGQVVSSGDALMRIVPPEDAGLEIECYLPNKDVGFVKIGQKAILKIEAFPFTRYGTIDAIVTNIAHDAIAEPDATQIEQDSSRAHRASMPAGADRVQNLVYAVTLHPLKSVVDVDGLNVPISTGMTVTTEIRTGSQRILDYILSPIAQIRSEALRER